MTVAPRNEIRGDEKQIPERAALKETAPCTSNVTGVVEKSASAGKSSLRRQGEKATRRRWEVAAPDMAVL